MKADEGDRPTKVHRRSRQMKSVKAILVVSLSATACLGAAPGAARQAVDYVNPFIGTTNPGLRWMLFPGASMPFGMVKLSPDNRGRVRRAGYDYRSAPFWASATCTRGR
jgi:putative alpha-1,2-mannosidase